MDSKDYFNAVFPIGVFTWGKDVMRWSWLKLFQRLSKFICHQYEQEPPAVKFD